MQTSKTNYKKKRNKNIPQNILCFACLSADRKLYKLLEFRDIFRQICKNIVQGMHSEILLCFECLALLRNVKRFQDKVQKSQNILKSYKQGDVETKISKNLSNLCTVFDVLDCSNLVDYCKPVYYEAFSDAKPNLDSTMNIKLEEENLNADDLNTIDWFVPIVETEKVNVNREHIKDNILPLIEEEYDVVPIFEGEIKEDKEKDLKSYTQLLASDKKGVKKKRVERKRLHINKDRSELYKFIRSDNTQMSNVHQRVKIPYGEVKYWLEKERNSEYFKRIKYKCEKCAKIIVKRDLQEHERRHAHYSENLYYSCDYCTLSFRQRVNLINHISLHQYIRCCKFCDYKCISTVHMYSHVRNEHTTPRVQCLQCKTNFKNTRRFYEHYHKEHYEINKTFICDYCNKKFAQRSTIEQHIFSNHTNINLPYTHACSKCPLTFSSPLRLKQHDALKHSVSRTDASYCVKCERQFDNVPQFRNHLRHSIAHRGERKTYKPKPRKSYKHYHKAHQDVNETFTCDYCNKKFTQRRLIERHIFRCRKRRLRDSRVPVYYNFRQWADILSLHNHTTHSCTKCSLTFNAPSRLKQHYTLRHSVSRSEDSYCVKCDRQFDNVPQFRKHLNYAVAHREEKKTHLPSPSKQPIKCLTCPNVYAKRSNMMNHYNKVHIGKTKYHCADCDKIFINNTALKYHNIRHHHEGHASHAKDRSHICYVCGRGFTVKRILTNHMRTHTGERPFECPHCDSKFAQKYAMYTHVKKIHHRKM